MNEYRKNRCTIILLVVHNEWVTYRRYNTQLTHNEQVGLHTTEIRGSLDKSSDGNKLPHKCNSPAR